MAANIGSLCHFDRLTQWQNPILGWKTLEKIFFGIGTVSALYKGIKKEGKDEKSEG